MCFGAFGLSNQLGNGLVDARCWAVVYEAADVCGCTLDRFGEAPVGAVSFTNPALRPGAGLVTTTAALWSNSDLHRREGIE